MSLDVLPKESVIFFTNALPSFSVTSLRPSAACHKAQQRAGLPVDDSAEDTRSRSLGTCAIAARYGPAPSTDIPSTYEPCFESEKRACTAGSKSSLLSIAWEHIAMNSPENSENTPPSSAA